MAEVAAPAAYRCMTKEELTHVCGYSSPSRQVQWVREQLGLTTAVRADGRPSLTWAAYEQALLRSRSSASTEGDSAPEEQPRWTK